MLTKTVSKYSLDELPEGWLGRGPPPDWQRRPPVPPVHLRPVPRHALAPVPGHNTLAVRRLGKLCIYHSIVSM